MRKIFILPVLSVMVLTTGCSMDVTLEQLSKAPVIGSLIQKSKMAGLTSGSTQSGKTTDNSYTVQTTVGSYTSNMDQTTSDKSYKVYSSVQGGLVAQ
ncbi:MAG: hypothetical protein ACXVCY_11240 [Pseudobdellovibrionaceae bacterium]